ncbi:unnamed protein product [Merluccius merluccius]
MRRLQLTTSLDGPSQNNPPSPCHALMLPEEEEDEEEDVGNGEQESLSHYEDGRRGSADGSVDRDSLRSCTYCCRPASRV